MEGLGWSLRALCNMTGPELDPEGSGAPAEIFMEGRDIVSDMSLILITLMAVWKRMKQEAGRPGEGIQKCWWPALSQHHRDGEKEPHSRVITQEKSTGVCDGLAVESKQQGRG